ncbi:hypothetical protein [Massilia horti]|uniref:Uncharacterized protein n=1 Tax=Massilia horti TaxID=2562153 RepID=A0A4Y9T6L6_9BURK|nr:hypothetical protein [Massilia horti]TFW33640.1 hypothetical protein E4O92_06505 [Massilia horti]
MTSSIALILDPQFGTRVFDLAKDMPVWIVASEQNKRAVEQARAKLGITADITTLSPAKEDANDTCVRALYDIDEHHGAGSLTGGYQQVRIFGCAPESVTPALMQELGFGRICATGSEFTLEKS